MRRDGAFRAHARHVFETTLFTPEERAARRGYGRSPASNSGAHASHSGGASPQK